MKRLAVFVLILAILAGLGWLGYRVYRKLTQESLSPKGRGGAVAVEVAPVTFADIQDEDIFTGSLRASAQFVVAPKIPGRLERLLVDVGDSVRRGQLVATLDGDEYGQVVKQAAAELEVARANVEEARSALEISQRDYDRVSALREKGIASVSEMDQADADLKIKTAKHKVALAQITQRQAALAAAEVRYSYTQISASWQGEDQERIVGERFVDGGETLRANDPIVSVLAINPLSGLIYVSERDYSRIKVGQAVALSTDAYPRQTFTGRVKRIAPLLKEVSRAATIEIDVPNADQQLKPGMFIRAHLIFAVHPHATIVPDAALVRRGGATGVFLADAAGRKARFVPVTVGVRREGIAEILEPALTGNVVKLGQHLLEDGSAIRIVETALPSTQPASQPSSASTTTAPRRPATGAVR